MTCTTCGQENSEGFRFCGRCGSPLTRETEQRRKPATLIFCDASGSTAMGERLDVEAVPELMFVYFHEMRSSIERHGGTVEKFVGDAVMAVFGVPEAHEDDPLRACRAAVEMQLRLSRLNEELERRYGSSLAPRIGVNTGDLVTGDASTRETFVSGDAVNTAARLEQAASPGDVLLGETTLCGRHARTPGGRARGGRSRATRRVRELPEPRANYWKVRARHGGARPRPLRPGKVRGGSQVRRCECGGRQRERRGRPGSAPGRGGEAARPAQRPGAAVALAGEAVALMETTDMLNVKGRVLSDLGEVLLLADRRDEASRILAEAARLYDQKGNLPSAERARRLAEDLTARAAVSTKAAGHADKSVGSGSEARNASR